MAIWRRVGGVAPLAAMACVAVSGCSFALVHGPPVHTHRYSAFDCTDSRTIPAIDTVGAAASGLGALLALAGGMSSGPKADPAATGSGNDSSPAVVAGSFALMGAVYGMSAIYGFSKVADCRAALEQAGDVDDHEGSDEQKPPKKRRKRQARDEDADASPATAPASLQPWAASASADAWLPSPPSHDSR